MTSAVFYGSPTKLTNAHKPVHTGSGRLLKNGGYAQSPYFVRMKYFPGDALNALHKAKPLPGEIVLNSVQLDLTEAEMKRQLIAEVWNIKRGEQ